MPKRSPDGGLGHWQGSHQLWVDTLYMACPLLSALGQMERKPEYVQDAANQIIVHARHLQDAKTGLIYHMWDWQTGTHSEGFWGRGDGWVLMSLAETLEVMKKGDPKFKELVAIARNLARGLEETQDRDGLWHTVLDDPKSYPESSATAMFTYGMLKLVRLHVLPAKYNAIALKAWQAVNERYVKDGVVTGVSAGTSPKGVDTYRTTPVGSRDVGDRSVPAGGQRSGAKVESQMSAIWTGDNDLFAQARRELFTAVVGDIMDKLGLRHQFLPPAIQPLDRSMVTIGRAMTVLEADYFEEIVPKSNSALSSRPFGLMLDALDDLKPNEVYICTGRLSSLCAVGRTDEHSRHSLWGCGRGRQRIFTGYKRHSATWVPDLLRMDRTRRIRGRVARLWITGYRSKWRERGSSLATLSLAIWMALRSSRAEQSAMCSPVRSRKRVRKRRCGRHSSKV